MRAWNSGIGYVAYLRFGVMTVAAIGALGGCTDHAVTAPGATRGDARLEAIRSANDSSGVDASRIMLSNRFAYVWAEQESAPLGVWYGPSPSYSDNDLRLVNRARRTAVRHYEVSFGGMLHPNAATGKVILIATAYGSTPIRRRARPRPSARRVRGACTPVERIFMRRHCLRSPR